LAFSLSQAFLHKVDHLSVTAAHGLMTSHPRLAAIVAALIGADSDGVTASAKGRRVIYDTARHPLGSETG